MKNSPSTSSLIDLSQSDPTCFVCLELTNEQGEAIMNGKDLRMCGCQFYVHPICWNTWLANGKTEFDCPICRRAVIGREKEISDETVRRVRTHSFPYADESYTCCIELPEMNTYRFLILVGVILIFSLFLFVGLIKSL
jgi:hypothetical protein